MSREDILRLLDLDNPDDPADIDSDQSFLPHESEESSDSDAESVPVNQTG